MSGLTKCITGIWLSRYLGVLASLCKGVLVEEVADATIAGIRVGGDDDLTNISPSLTVADILQNWSA